VKKIIFILLAVAVLGLLMSGTALANFGPHGGYATDTDACAGCHRAHTSFSSITWKDSFDTSHSALLVSNASNMSQFCNACHGDGKPGAGTNVVGGTFNGAAPTVDVDGGPSTAALATTSAIQPYKTASADGAVLNGGGFTALGTKSATSLHDMDKGAATDPMWGANFAAPAGTNLSCDGCHDPHGSSNYRLLKDNVNSVRVGGYDSATGEIPSPFVISREAGYPETGWLKHTDGAAQMGAYTPNYTSPLYAYQPPAIPEGGTDPEFRSMSAWCGACHTQYVYRDDTTRTPPTTYDYSSAPNGGGTGMGGNVARHRHPVNITLTAGVGAGRSLQAEVKLDSLIPLELKPSNAAIYKGVVGNWGTDDYLGCLTCHRAHGTDATMTGWATAKLGADTYPSIVTTVGGVNPNWTSALLRTDNRGVCERCHNK
jgi:predicted CXXCH cytochrome family protein